MRVLLPRPQIRWSTGLRILGWIVTVLLAVVGTLTGVAGLGLIVFLFVLLHGIEVLFPRHDQPLKRPGLSVDLLWAVVGSWARLVLMGLVLLLIAGAFDPLAIASAALLFAVIVPFIHSNVVRWRLWPLRGIVITPEFHHWHHAQEREAWDKNYSAHLPVWDLLFGTYYMPKDRRPSTYGSPDPVPEDFSGQLLYPFAPKRFQSSLEHPGVAVKVPGGVVFTPTEPEVIGS